MTITLNEETCVIYDDFSEMAAGIVTEVNDTSIVIEDENINGSTTALRIDRSRIDDVVT